MAWYLLSKSIKSLKKKIWVCETQRAHPRNFISARSAGLSISGCMIALYSHVWLIWTMLHRHFTSNSSFKYQPTPSAAKKILKIVCAAIEAFLGFWLPSNSMHGLFKRFCMGVIHEIPVLTPLSFTLLPPKSNVFFFLKKSSNGKQEND